MKKALLTRLLFLPLWLLGGTLMLSGCASNPEDKPERTEAEHYRETQKLLAQKSFYTAIEQLEELEARFPYGDYAEQAQLDLIYVHYRSLDYPEAAAVADRFLRVYPGSEHIDYVLYMQGLAYYNMDRGLLTRILPHDDSSRDLTSAKQAFDIFSDLVKRFPDSEYAPDSRTRMLYIRNQLAKQELHAARYYARRKSFIAAANRAQQVVKHYQETTSVPTALAIMSEAYRELEKPALAEKSRAVLAHNFPEYPHLKGDKVDLPWWPKPDKRTWINLITFDLL